jgi:hypothetical protein
MTRPERKPKDSDHSMPDSKAGNVGGGDAGGIEYVPRLTLEALRGKANFYSPDQERDNRSRWAGGGGNRLAFPIAVGAQGFDSDAVDHVRLMDLLGARSFHRQVSTLLTDRLYRQMPEFWAGWN